MTSQPPRDPLADHLITPQNSAFLLIDWQSAQPISCVSLAGELQRDWARQETVPALVEIVLTDRLLRESGEVAASV